MSTRVGPTNSAPADGARKGGTASDLSDVPALRDFINRIGATPRSMLTAVVREYHGVYWRDTATVRLDKSTGEITLRRADGGDASALEPTDIERQLIKAACVGVNWPALAPLAANPNGLPPLPPELQSVHPDNLFSFVDAEGRVVMVQRRATEDEVKAGKPKYTPFTHWSDNVWRMMEPDGLLPLYGLDKIGTNTTVFLHEGAKAARVMQELTADSREGRKLRAGHPWGNELDGAAHVGWIGGALATERTNWSSLHEAGVQTVYIVADNDDSGKSAVPNISHALSHWGIKVRAVRFTADFPAGFDLADPFPANVTSPFSDFVDPAIWATRIGTAPAPEGKGRPKAPPILIRKEFLDDWWMVAGEGKALFIGRHDPSKLYTEDAFNTVIRQFSDTPRTGDLFKRKGYASTVSAIAYEPGAPEGEIIVEGERCVNTWTRPRVIPAAGDPTPFLDFAEKLFPEPTDRHEALRWCATLIALPRVRMAYGLLLASTVQGVGKTTLCEILRVLVGEKNCSSPSAGHVVDSDFNSWIVRKRFVFVNEIYEGTSWRAYQKLKSYVTDIHLEANEKMVKTYSVKNWAHFVLCSNAEVPISIEMEDRRFLVPQVTETKRDTGYWSGFYDWLASGGYAIIAGWAAEFVKKPGNAVRAGEPAPSTARKRKLIEDSRSPEELLVMGMAEAVRSLSERDQCQVVLVEDEVVAWLKHRTGQDRRAVIVRSWLRKGGLFVSADRMKVRGRNTHVLGAKPLADSWPELEPYTVRPTDLEGM